MNVRFHPDAEREIEEAVAWYDGLSQRLGDDFLKELEQALERIIKFPEAWAIFSTNTRRCRLQKFPYGIVYRLVSDDIQVIAVMHLHRKPDYWTERVEADAPSNGGQNG
jgi:plasmid stabilization system protein ParE